MKHTRTSWFLIGALFAVLFGGLACSGDDNGEGEDQIPQPQPACDPDTTPIVFAHGVFELGDAFAAQSMRFASNGYCIDRIYALDWNTLGNFSQELERLKEFVDQVLAETGASRIDLIGHSMGTFLSMRYLSDPANAAKVAHYANLAGLGASAPPGGVPTIAISSEDDYIAGVSNIIGAENIHPPGLDHLQVATSEETFQHLYRFFTDGKEPLTTGIEPTDAVTLSGGLLTFGENQPAPGLELRIYPVDPATGNRLDATPIATFIPDTSGYWGPFKAKPGQHYEYEIHSTSQSARPIHYYREPLPRSCNLVYFRVFPPLCSLPGLLLALLPYSDDYALLATLHINQAVVAGRDTLFVDGYEVSTPEVTPPEKTAIAIFFFDANRNGVSDGQAAGGFFEAMPFIQAFDLRVDTTNQRPVPLVFNGRMNSVQNWKSDSQGVTIAVFE